MKSRKKEYQSICDILFDCKDYFIKKYKIKDFKLYERNVKNSFGMALVIKSDSYINKNLTTYYIMLDMNNIFNYTSSSTEFIDKIIEIYLHEITHIILYNNNDLNHNHDLNFRLTLNKLIFEDFDYLKDKLLDI